MPRPLAEELAPYGAPPDLVIDLHAERSARHVSYLDLLARDPKKRLPDAVVEIRRESVAYVVDARERALQPREIGLMRRILSFRDDAPYLTVIEPGRLTVYGVALDDITPAEACLSVVEKTEPRARTTFQCLQTRPDEFTWQLDREQTIEKRLFDLLTRAVDGLMDCGVGRDDAISLAGRALFTRFLLDRGILQGEHLGHVYKGVSAWEDVFSTAAHVRATCAWLDRTFNGDFLPVSMLADANGFEALAGNGCELLIDIMHRSRDRQTTFSWATLDFAHIPVGVLSQVYESQAEHWDPAVRQHHSMYYTPRRIAEYMVKEAFAFIADRGRVPPHKARVLDPAAGGGVFLVAALREIATAWWRHHGRAPDSRELRQLLYGQIAGFDINEPALRLSALSLYLTVIELDGNPTELEHLRFAKPLRDRVLYLVREPEAGPKDAAAGSLGPMVGDEHRGAYDLVIGNPPWTSVSSATKSAKRVYRVIRETIAPTVRARLGTERAKTFELPDKVPDLPFVWRAMEWAKAGACIALALHGRLLFKGSAKGEQARSDLFDAIEVTGVLNGADLRLTNVWPKVGAPFCLVFANNQQPGPDSALYFVSPYEERHLNDQGRLRIDATAAHAISLSRLRKRPYLFKTLFRGTALDADVLHRLYGRGWPTFESWWKQTHGNSSTGQGYQRQGETNDASFLHVKRNLNARRKLDFIVDTDPLPYFSEPGLHRPRDPAIYRGPLFLVKESPPADRDAVKATVCRTDLAYNESFYGYSAHGHEQANEIVQYASLLVHSEVFLWHALMTSGKFGVERESLLKLDVDEFPVVPFDSLADARISEIPHVFNAMVNERAWHRVNDWVSDIYELDRWDREVIRDTLSVSTTYREVKSYAQERPDAKIITCFAERLHNELAPFVPGLHVREVSEPWARSAPWCLFTISMANRQTKLASPLVTGFMDQADDLGASQLVLHDDKSARLLLGVLRQNRYFTPSRARLCSLQIIEEHLDALARPQSSRHAS